MGREFRNGLPITWEFSPFSAGDNRGNAILEGEHFLQYYGVSETLHFNNSFRGRHCKGITKIF